MVLNLKTNNIIQGSNILKSLFDFSNLNEGNKLFCEENKKKLVNLKLKLLVMFG